MSNTKDLFDFVILIDDSKFEKMKIKTFIILKYQIV